MKSLKLFILIFTLSYINLSECISTYSIDLSSEFIKVAIVIPGVPMEIALNGESQKKTPAVVFIKGNERLFGEPALNMGVKYPKNLYHSITTLIGKTIDHSVVQAFIKNFPYYNMIMNDNNQLSFQDGNIIYTVEELLAMIIENSKTIAETYSEMPMKSGVIVVPPYFTQDERHAVLRAAAIVDINVLQLINSNTAVGLNYGIFRQKSFNSSVQYYMFYDVGSSATVASIIGYQFVKRSKNGISVDTPQLSVVGVGYDRTLGASQFILRVQMHLANAFNAAKKTQTDVFTVPRSMAKLYKEAGRVVKVLSANNEIYAQIENVLDDQDFKLKISRSQFEDMCSDLFVRFSEPVHRALESAQIPMPVIREVILMGGGTRIPRIQDILMKASDRLELGKGINTDEAAAMGAVYLAASISPGFKVQTFLMKDSNLAPIYVDFERYKTDEKTNTKTAHHASRPLFNAMDQFPLTKSIPFNKQTNNFDFNVTSDTDKKVLFHVTVDNMTAVYEEHMAESDNFVTEFKHMIAHFVINDSGLLSLSNVEAIFERKWHNGKEEEEIGAFKKIGNKLSSIFGSGENKEGEESKTVDQVNANGTTSNETVSNATDSKTNQSITVHQNLLFVSTWKSVEISSEKVHEMSREKILKLKAIDDKKMALEKSKNELESYIFDLKSRFETEKYRQCSSEAERTAVLEAAQQAGDWYEEQGMDTGREEYVSKYTALQSLMRDIDVRVKELDARPDAMSRLTDILNNSKQFLAAFVNMSGDGPDKMLTTTEYDSMARLIADTTKWFATTNETLRSMRLDENPQITAADFESQSRALERERNYLLNKISIWKARPPPTPTPSSNKTSTEDQTTNSTQPDTPTVTPEAESRDDDEKREDLGKEEEEVPPQQNGKDEHSDL